MSQEENDELNRYLDQEWEEQAHGRVQEMATSVYNIVKENEERTTYSQAAAFLKHLQEKKTN